jgi:putative FmdB family regulatory protein
MPVYEYLCNECGPFTDMRPMAECDLPQDCPQCESEAPRVILTAPAFFCMPSDKRKAHATNERSANAPKTVGEYKASHAPGCGCCSSKKPARLVTKTKGGAKGFPTDASRRLIDGKLKPKTEGDPPCFTATFPQATTQSA